MSRESVAWVTVKPSAARASRSSSWLSIRRSRTTRRIAAWRWIFMPRRLGSVHVPSSQESGDHVLPARRQAPVPPAPPAGRPGADDRAVAPLPRLQTTDLPLEPQRPRPAQRREGQRGIGVEIGQPSRRARLGEEVEACRRSGPNRCPVPRGVPHARKPPSGASPCRCAALLSGQCATAAALAGQSRQIGLMRLDHVNAERALPQHPMLARAIRPASVAGRAGSGIPRSRQASANGPVPRRSSSDSAGDSARCTASGRASTAGPGGDGGVERPAHGVRRVGRDADPDPAARAPAQPPPPVPASPASDSRTCDRMRPEDLLVRDPRPTQLGERPDHRPRIAGVGRPWSRRAAQQSAMPSRAAGDEVVRASASPSPREPERSRSGNPPRAELRGRTRSARDAYAR